jgi:Flp pilus assembly protein TadB
VLGGSSSGRAVWVHVGLGIGAAVIVGLPLGPVAGVGIWFLLRRRAASRRRTADGGLAEETALDLALAAELVAAAGSAGIPTPVAAHTVGDQLSGAVGEWLVRAARRARWGASPDVAWAVDDLDQALGEETLGYLAAFGALVATEERTGAAAGSGLRSLAADLRAQSAASDLARARSAGIFVVVPLGLCFLPAFVLVGVVPVVAGAFRGVLG